MRMLRERRRPRPVRRHGAVAFQTKLVACGAKLRVVRRSVHVVTIEARHAAPVHYALHEVISLHAVLVRGAIRKMREGRFAELMLLELPEVRQPKPHSIADRPIVIAASVLSDGIF